MIIPTTFEVITPKKKISWGYVEHPTHEGHFYTGYSEQYYAGKNSFSPKHRMHIGENVHIKGEFKVTGTERGRSAAYFLGHFIDAPEVQYEISMSGMLEYIKMLQSHSDIDNTGGYILGKWTIAKKGQSIFLEPVSVL